MPIIVEMCDSSSDSDSDSVHSDVSELEAEFDKERSVLKAKIKDLKADNRDHEADIKDLEHQLSRALEHISVLEQTGWKLQQDLNYLHQEKCELDNSLDAQTNQYRLHWSQLTCNFQQLEADIAALHAEKGELENNLDIQASHHQLEVDQHTSEIHRLKTELALLRAEKSQLVNSQKLELSQKDFMINDLQTQWSSMSRLNAQLKREWTFLRRQASEIHAASVQHQVEVKGLLQDNATLSSELEGARQELDTSKSELEGARQELDTSKAEYCGLLAAAATSREEQSTAEMEMAWQSRVEELQLELQQAVRDKQTAGVKVNDLDDKLKWEQQQVCQLLLERDRLAKLVEQLQVDASSSEYAVHSSVVKRRRHSMVDSGPSSAVFCDQDIMSGSDEPAVGLQLGTEDITILALDPASKADDDLVSIASTDYMSTVSWIDGAPSAVVEDFDAYPVAAEGSDRVVEI